MFAGENVKITKNEFKSKIEEAVGLGSNEHGYFDFLYCKLIDELNLDSHENWR